MAEALLVGAGAVLGAWLRWMCGIFFNPIFPTLPLGTVVANLLGGLLMGVMIEITRTHTYIPEITRLALTTGFLGALTTFSTFSGEVTLMLLKQEYLWALAAIVIHVGGSLMLTLTGMFFVKWSMGW
ncbi:MAG: CrcB protein [Chlamydiales bacterium]|jgi:CrcB protein